ncbi:MAG: hypothetical protein COV62_02205, partial [Candidatus Nealsonbacteria bacterium CG11_big_fil_rev_8_21_14_0_20_35_11]
MERCKSGLIGGPGKTVYRKVPWVRIPPSPQLKNRHCRFFNCGAFWLKSEPILGKIPTLIFSPPPAA